ncbi:hypothetical protein AI3057V1_1466 [Citrobacter freundii]|uniref:ATP-binding protein n=1 Tax=Citrobacter freundii TaxID=546 RepID=UPI001D8E1C3E|nr:ATP-binding protein [Citrobacter freundii]CAG0338776.1 hypothetical protein AI3057V1_1466 [Citrobacter freundii]CAH6020008.1 hypothetical protein AI3057V1_1466 [Citrobacter freundii]
MNASDIRKMVVMALTNATDAADRVFSPRDWPTSPVEYPALLIQTPFDHKKAMGRNTPSFTTVTTVRITGRVQEYDGETDDDGAMRAEVALEDLREQVERAVINSYELTRKIQKYAEVRSTINVDADGEAHMGQLLYEIDIEYYQGPEDFYPVETVPLEGMDIAIAMPDGTPQPGISINLQE